MTLATMNELNCSHPEISIHKKNLFPKPLAAMRNDSENTIFVVFLCSLMWHVNIKTACECFAQTYCTTMKIEKPFPHQF